MARCGLRPPVVPQRGLLEGQRLQGFKGFRVVVIVAAAAAAAAAGVVVVVVVVVLVVVVVVVVVVVAVVIKNSSNITNTNFGYALGLGVWFF